MLRNQSVETIAAPQFINIQPYNPLISQCEIKVLYVGENRNGSYITEEVAKNMANSLPGTPIVAAFIEEKNDFGDHGEVITIEDGEIKFSCKTQPYGFVAPNAKVWFKDFIDTDRFGNEIERKYLMTEGYLWTGQFPEIAKVLEEGMPQSMELDSQSLDGEWAECYNSGIELFIINDAMFSKLCILGSDVEPCFEGASVTEKNVSKNFSCDNSLFMNTLFTMMNELKEALQYSEGGITMDPQLENKRNSNVDSSLLETGQKPADEPAVVEEENSEPAVEANEPSDAGEANEHSEANEPSDAGAPSDSGDSFALYKKKEKCFNDDDEEDSDDDDDKESEDSDDNKEPEDSDDNKKEPSANHSLEELETQFAELKNNYSLIEKQLAEANSELETLRSFKLSIENEQKDALIAKYHMLSDEDKAEIIKNKSEYSLSEIESKLALLYVNKNVDFSTITGEAETEPEKEASPITTFSLDSAVDMTDVPAIVKALRATK